MGPILQATKPIPSREVIERFSGVSSLGSPFKEETNLITRIGKHLPEVRQVAIIQPTREKPQAPRPPERNSERVGGRLSHFTAAWDQAPKWHRKIVSHGVRWKFRSLPPKRALKAVYQSAETSRMLREFLD